MKQKKEKLLLIGLILLFIYYFSIPMNIFWDTGHYMSFVSIFEGTLPWSSWDIVRGAVFPLIIHFSNILFGKTTQGILFLSFIFYLVMLITVKFILDGVFEKEKSKLKNIIYIGIFSFIIFDPLIYGYYHALLTEFVAITISTVICYLSWKWLDISFLENKKKFIIYGIIFFIGTILSWHLKQPYVTITLFPIIVASIVSIVHHCNWKNICQRLTTVFVCIIGLSGSIILWNQFLISKGIDLNTDRNVTASFGNQLLIGLNNYQIIENADLNKKEDSQFLSKKERTLLNENKGKYYLININNTKGKTIDQTIVPLNNKNNVSTSTSIIFIIKQLFKHPYLVLESYISNYLAIANLYPKKTNDGVSYWIEKDLTLNYCHENCSIAVSVANKKSNISYMLEEPYKRVLDYEQYNNSPIYIRYGLKGISYITTNLYKLLLLILPILTVISTISFVKHSKKNESKTLSIALILLWYSFLHILVHVATGANIDRYASPAYITTIIGITIYMYYVINKKNIENKRSDKNVKKKQR